MNVAIVILNWNGRKMMEKYLPSVLNYSCREAEVIVADNASTDDSVSWLRESYPHVRVIQLDQNYGFAEGYNQALRQIDSKYYLLLNSDVEVTHHWLTTLIEEMDAHDDVAACQPKILSVVNRDSFEYAGASGGFIDRYGYPFCRGRIFDTVEEDNGQYDNTQEILWATGACLMIRSCDYWAAGGLDGRFFAHNEEIDLCWRLHRMGKRIFCFPESVVYHLGGGTLPKSNPRKTFLNFRNNLTMLWKNLPEDDLRHVMRIRWFLDYLAAFQTLVLNRNWGDFKAIVSARRAFKQWKKDFPRDINVNKTVYDTPAMLANCTVDGRKRYSVLWEYYVHGRKLFSSLPERDVK
ncbi:MAG: glycosyltransferase family 2 protein [Prevotella histicola]|jgi:glycosyltransferase, group 2 family|uniref:glycosyltransferase family 2 protein n=1 Tax=Prevotella histicola TaxID=470565 RepID=UPI001C5E5FD1|nr:glycosyltransferase family 2 protein [Prevotella histicola]MBF1398702.1 glycosyltransferase family 2 protein [Prevotella histicola]MBF1422704.1 glycosyltransferase family 2 protein [Prevotella histicola]MBS5898618.1 glycosyltransferase family 2 protein [Prevotella histicola]MBW4757178.1 glycosyltransferase family 2 protein [Prevotella histicola]